MVSFVPSIFSFTGTELCMPHCWKKTVSKDISFNDGLLRKDIDSETACKNICYNTEICIGVYWGLKASLNKISCWLQMTSKGVSDSLTTVTHWMISNCTGTLNYMTTFLTVQLQTLGKGKKNCIGF